MDTILKRAWKTWVVGLIVFLVVMVCFIAEPTFVTTFCFGGCFSVFVLDTADLIYQLRKNKKENR